MNRVLILLSICCTGGLGSNPVVLEQKIVTNPAAAGLVSLS